MKAIDVDNKIDVMALIEAGEYLAAGYFEMPNASQIVRMSRALRRHYELAPLPDWNGDPVYPSGKVLHWDMSSSAVGFMYTSGLMLNQEVLQEKIKQWNGTYVAETLRAAGDELKTLYVMGNCIPMQYSLGGAGYTHSMLNYGRIVKDGLSGYARRIEQCAENCDESKADFYSALIDLIEGIRAIVARSVDFIRSKCNEPWASKLVSALEHVPENPARTFYEAIVATNFMWYLDGCDSIGRFDQDLGSYLDADLKSGTISRHEALDLVRLLWKNTNINDGWNVAIGGTDKNGNAAYNTLTELCLEAAAGSRRPNLALRVRKDIPEKVFDLAIDAISTGCGLPALYNDEAYAEMVKKNFSTLPGDEFIFAFGGCTETMMHGCSNVGSIDGGINLLEVLSDSIKKHLAASSSYADFEDKFVEDMRVVIDDAVKYVNLDQKSKSASQPLPLRTLFIDDCIEKGIDYNSGGARYNCGVFNLGGLANVVDSLIAIKELVFGNKVTSSEMLAALNSNFSDSNEIKNLIKACPKFGNDDDRVDEIAVRIAEKAFAMVKSHKTWRGNTPFMPGCIMFVTYDNAGKNVSATPDGRLAYEPVADSIGPCQGRDITGPTAMLRSVSKLPLKEAIGTPVLNIRFAKGLFDSPTTREKVKSLIRTYFSMGGMQIQVSVVDQKVLRDAIDHPEKHQDLIIRIGGYSEYFNNLSEELKHAVLQRTEHC